MGIILLLSTAFHATMTSKLLHYKICSFVLLREKKYFIFRYNFDLHYKFYEHITILFVFITLLPISYALSHISFLSPKISGKTHDLSTSHNDCHQYRTNTVHINCIMRAHKFRLLEIQFEKSNNCFGIRRQRGFFHVP